MSVRTFSRGPIVVTGGAGFLGAELTHRLLEGGERVRVLDDLSRPGAEENLRWLWERHRGALDVEPTLPGTHTRSAIADASAVFHLAGACHDGREDDAVSVHVGSALHVLTAARDRAVPVVMASTMNVLGSLAHLALRTRPQRVEPEDPRLRGGGLSEKTAARPETVEGVSCFTAERYALSHARSHGVPVTVLRFGELVGPPRAAQQAPGRIHALIASALSEGQVLFDGDGRNVHDLLFVDDAVKALLVARRKLGALVGGLFHVGGGPLGALSERELVGWLSRLKGRPIGTREGDERPSLPRWRVLDSGRFHAATGWTPHVSTSVALARLYHWRRMPGRVARPVTVDMEMPG